MLFLCTVRLFVVEEPERTWEHLRWGLLVSFGSWIDVGCCMDMYELSMVEFPDLSCESFALVDLGSCFSEWWFEEWELRFVVTVTVCRAFLLSSLFTLSIDFLMIAYAATYGKDYLDAIDGWSWVLPGSIIVSSCRWSWAAIWWHWLQLPPASIRHFGSRLIV